MTSVFYTNTCWWYVNYLDRVTCSWSLTLTLTHLHDLYDTCVHDFCPWHLHIFYDCCLWHWHMFRTSVYAHDTDMFMSVTLSPVYDLFITLKCSWPRWHHRMFMTPVYDTIACLWPQSMTPSHVYDLSLRHHHMFMTTVCDTIAWLWPQSMSPSHVNDLSLWPWHVNDLSLWHHVYDLSLWHHHMLTTSVYDTITCLWPRLWHHHMLITSVYDTIPC